jgi:hypothetical protein
MSGPTHIAIHFTPAAGQDELEKVTQLLDVNEGKTKLEPHPKGNTLHVDGISSQDAGPELEKGWPDRVVYAPSVATIFLNLSHEKGPEQPAEEAEAPDTSQECDL